MFVIQMFVRSLLGYVIFLSSRKLVRGFTGIGNELIKAFDFRRCVYCFKLHSGEHERCLLCGSHVDKCYKEYESTNYNQDQEEAIDYNIEKEYRRTQSIQYQPLKKKNYYGRNNNRTKYQSGRSYQGRNRSFARAS